MAARVLSEADLHGLVDGHLDADRRAEVLRCAAASPRDRALVECWQDQNDLIRAAFAGVEHEPLPSSLDLRRPPQLHAVPLSTLASATAAPRWRRNGGIAATMVAVAVGLAGSWYIAGQPAESRGMTGQVPHFVDGSERMLADRTISALAFGESDPSMPSGAAEPSPTATIPDLSGAGFTFLGAEARGMSPRYLVFRYRNAADDRVAIGTTRNEGGDMAPVRRDTGYTWRSGHVAYAIFGTVPPERLRTLAGSLVVEPQPD